VDPHGVAEGARAPSFFIDSTVPHGMVASVKKNGMEARSVGLDIRAYLISASSSLVQVVSFQFIQIQISDLICMLYLQLIILSVVNDVPIDSEVFLMTDFMNLKIKPVPSFKDAHRDMIYVYVFIGMSTINCICTIF
jgi:hypothetical protein